MFSTAFVRRAPLAVLVVLGLLAVSGVAHGDVTFKVGNSTGLIQEANDADGAVKVVTLVASDGFRVVFQLDKLWLQPSDTEPAATDLFTSVGSGTSPVGTPAGPTRITTVFMPSRAEAGIAYFDIILGDEKISNQSSVVWKDFHITVAKVLGDGEVCLSGTPIPGPRLPQVQLVDQQGMGQLDFFGGEWANDGAFVTLFTSNLNNDPVKIRVTLGEQRTQLIIKEWPTVPEPATMGLLGVGSLGAIVTRVRRRKRA